MSGETQVIAFCLVITFGKCNSPCFTREGAAPVVSLRLVAKKEVLMVGPPHLL